MKGSTRMDRTHIVITSINAPNEAMERIRDGCLENHAKFWIVGDSKTPGDFSLAGSEYLSIERQLETGFEYARIVPTRHYARKNIGYLCSIRDGAERIVETDDDNLPLPGFWSKRTETAASKVVTDQGWSNVYRYFTDASIWPRGFPLSLIKKDTPSYSELQSYERKCPIQQGLVNENPDVDAIYRLVLPMPLSFSGDRAVALDRGAWCPFNSQNTTWWRDAFPLLYLPYYCSFRMTDIWRSLVAQRILWENDWSLLFHSPTMWQDRNDHDLMKDFEDEIVGYVNNYKIAEKLSSLSLKPGRSEMLSNLVLCYEAMIDMGIVGKEEMKLLRAWCGDLSSLLDMS